MIVKSEKAYKSLLKEDSVIIKENIVGHLEVDLETLTKYCKNKFPGEKKNFNGCEETKDEIMTLLKKIGKEVGAYNGQFMNTVFLDIDEMADDYCECMDKNSLDEMSECLESFKRKYEKIKGSDEQKREFEEKIKERCGDM